MTLVRAYIWPEVMKGMGYRVAWLQYDGFGPSQRGDNIARAITDY